MGFIHYQAKKRYIKNLQVEPYNLTKEQAENVVELADREMQKSFEQSLKNFSDALQIIK